MPRMRRSTTTASHRTTSTPSNTHLDQLTTEVLCLRCDQLKLSATGSRQALLTRLRSVPRQGAVVTNPPEDAEPEPAASVNYTTATTPADREPSTSGFSSEQFQTLQSLIASSLRDVTVPQLTPVTVPPEPEVPSTSRLYRTLAQCLQHFCSGSSPFFPVQGV